MSTQEALQGLVDWARTAGHETIHFRGGESLMREGELNSALFILLKGQVRLSKIGKDGVPRPLDLLGPGSLIGILSFWTGKQSFSDSNALGGVECLKVERELFDQAVAEDAEFSRLTLQLLVANLSDRYKRVVGLNLKVAGLTLELEHERNALREAVTDLKQTRNQMIHREKLATMGQLLAGIAHEINNPSTSLMKNVEQLGEDVPLLLKEQPDQLRWFEAGREAAFVSTSESRERMEELLKTYPGLSRGQCRRLVRFPPALLANLEEDLRRSNRENVDRAIQLFDIGCSLNSIRIANERITRLVKGLKSYSRQDEGSDQGVDLAQCVRDTLMVLNHRLKNYEVQVEMEDLPLVKGRAGEVNQILTNLLTNVCEASAPGKQIQLRAGEGDGCVWLEIEDEGSGIPSPLLDKIFEPSVTTKSGGGQFGLGLGLAISKDLAMQHHGSLTARNREGGGAVFRLELPR
ncbi:MAG: ATP-binding protein [Kiritimatiellia bacterium]